MSAAVWSKAPKSIRQPPPKPETEQSDNNTKRTFVIENGNQTNTVKKQAPKIFLSVIPPGQKCRHDKWQPEAIETVRAKAWTCYECTFECAKCGLNSVGLCDSYDCS